MYEDLMKEFKYLCLVVDCKWLTTNNTIMGNDKASII